MSVITPRNDWTIKPVGLRHATLRIFIVNHYTLGLLFRTLWPVESCGAPVLRQTRVQNSLQTIPHRFPECLSFTVKIVGKSVCVVHKLVFSCFQLRNETTMNTYQCIGVVNATIQASNALEAATKYQPLDVWHDVIEVSVYRVGKAGRWGREQYFRTIKGGIPIAMPSGDGMD